MLGERYYPFKMFRQSFTSISRVSTLDHQLKMNCAVQVEEDYRPLAKPRDKWTRSIEFLLSCIAMSVGLGNIWRFPYTAYKNGGGAFLIPYVVVLFLVAKPIYFMEMILGQFSSKGCVKVYDFVPAFRGIGTGQTVAVSFVMTYYSSLMAVIIYYLFASFSMELPWSVCDAGWDDCFPSTLADNVSEAIGKKSSSELYFIRTVLKQLPDINNGIGAPDWKLALCLLIAWITVYFVVLKGVKSTGKAAYFLAVFPYIVIFVLLIRAVTLPGAVDGIIYFLKPDFSALLDPKVWFAAVSQCFFSLSVCFGVVIMYSSYNDFKHNMYKDALIVTSLDMVTSFLAGITIFGILGNLAQETGKDLKDVVQGGWDLAFITYPEAISKFKTVPQIFSVLFFLMLFTLAIGSIAAMVSCTVTVIRDRFPCIKRWQAVTAVTVCGYSVALLYLTPGGMYILNLVDHHGATFVVYILGIGQIIAVSWIYGIRRFCNDIEFMLKMKVSIYWRLCWSVLTPMILIVILTYSLITLEKISYNGVEYPTSAIVCGWLLSGCGIFLLPLFAMIAFYKRRDLGIPEMFLSAFRPREEWGPVDLSTKKEWLTFIQEKEIERAQEQRSKFQRIFDKVLGY
ncbi:sodium-dependent nutrient amino acid transporter 1-like [Arctopsyche grandis]|uniref:sodium-dependent nutrient amino acid transporter 1-like n=1 Tax=Arctopsyche grandis TaxID=121162 RepID=UPI00406D677D